MIGYFIFGLMVGAIIGYTVAALLNVVDRGHDEE